MLGDGSMVYRKSCNMVRSPFQFETLESRLVPTNYFWNNTTNFNAEIADINTNSQDDTITLLEDITLTAALSGFSATGFQVTFEGAGFALARSGSAGNFRILDVSTSMTINNMTISDGLLSAANNGGAGIQFNAPNETLTINNSSFQNNVTTGTASGGGAIAIIMGSASIQSTNFDSNQTQGTNSSGGAIDFRDTTGTFNLTFGTLSNNSTTAAGSDGGFIANAGTMSLIVPTVLNNSTTGGGDGGYIVNTGTLRIINNQIQNCSAAAGGNGGAIANRPTGIIANLSGSGFTGNTADGSGGAIYNQGAIEVVDPLIDNGAIAAFFSGNTATTGSGGAIANVAGGTIALILPGVTINDLNTAAVNGGAIANVGGLIDTISGVTFSSNTATNGSGGAFYNAGA